MAWQTNNVLREDLEDFLNANFSTFNTLSGDVIEFIPQRVNAGSYDGSKDSVLIVTLTNE